MAPAVPGCFQTFRAALLGAAVPAGTPGAWSAQECRAHGRTRVPRADAATAPFRVDVDLVDCAVGAGAAQGG